MMGDFISQLARGFSAEGIVFVVLIIGVLQYLRFLRGARNKAVKMMDAYHDHDGFSDIELDRYARHIVLREIGGGGQTKLSKARVLVVGAGGLGSPILQYLGAAGVGTIGVIDDDEVSISNLQRQVLFDENQLGQAKVFAAQARIKAINPHVNVVTYARRLTANEVEPLIREYDLVLDGTDNFTTRKMVNTACVTTKTPLISGAISQWEGQVSLFDPANGAPCYNCIFPKEPTGDQAPTCAEAGVVGALPGVIGAMMATEAIKWITGAGVTLAGQMVIYDALYGENRKLKITKRTDCEVCAHL